MNAYESQPIASSSETRLNDRRKHSHHRRRSHQHNSPELRAESEGAGACSYVLKDDLQELVGVLNGLPPRANIEDSY